MAVSYRKKGRTHPLDLVLRQRGRNRHAWPHFRFARQFFAGREKRYDEHLDGSIPPYFEAYATGQTSIRVEWSTDPAVLGGGVERLEMMADGQLRASNVPVTPAAGFVAISGLEAGKGYTLHAFDKAGGLTVFRAQTPWHGGETAWHGKPTIGPDGKLYCCMTIVGDAIGLGSYIAYSVDGARTWRAIQQGGGFHELFVGGNDRLYFTRQGTGNPLQSIIGISKIVKERSQTTPLTQNRNHDDSVNLVLRNFGDASNQRAGFYPNWGFDHDPKHGIFAFGLNNQQTFDNTDAGTRLATSAVYVYWSQDGHTWKEMPNFPEDRPDRHIHVVKYNPVSRRWFVTTGDTYKTTFVSDPVDTPGFDFGDPLSWTEINPSTGLRGGCTGFGVVPDGILWGTDDGSNNRIFKTDHNGANPREVLKLTDYGAVDNRECFGLGVDRDTGEVWAQFSHPTAGNTNMVFSSVDRGETWRLAAMYAVSASRFGSICTSLHNFIPGRHIVISDTTASKPLYAFRKWR